MGKVGRYLLVSEALVEVLYVESLAVSVGGEGFQHGVDDRRVHVRSQVVVELQDLHFRVVRPIICHVTEMLNATE